MKPGSKLGICVPTYRRPEQLLRLVKSIAVSAKDTGVPVCISDDSADDTNRLVLEKIREIYPHVVYGKNSANLGIDGNILRSVDICPCEYAWLIGEDDRILPEGVGRLLEVLEKNSPKVPFVYVNYRAVDDDFRVVLKERSLPMQEDRITDAETFFEKWAWSMGFIGACVVRKESWDEIRREPYLGTYFAHVGVIMEAVKGRDIYMVAEPQVWNRCATPRTFTWVNELREVLGGWARLMKALETVYGRESCRRSLKSFESAHGLNTLKFLCYLRADGVLDPSVLKSFMQEKKGPWYRFAAGAVARTDPRVFRAMRSILSFYRGRPGRRLPGETDDAPR